VTATVLRVKRRRRAAAGIIALGTAVVVPFGRVAADETSARVIRYQNDVLTVRLRSVPIDEVLRDVAQQSGAEVRGQVREPRDVSAEFEAVPLPEALSRLLGDQAFALVYASGGRLKAVRLLGSDAISVPAVAIVPGERPPFPGPLPGLIDRHAAIPVTGAVAEALQSDSATFRQLLDLSLHHADGTVRAEAVRTGLAAVEADRELYVAVVAELDHVDSGVLAKLLRAGAGEHAEELAKSVSQGPNAAKFRLKASSVLQALRQAD
jgi:hypothetical protein